jgi:hypothetical protein
MKAIAAFLVVCVATIAFAAQQQEKTILRKDFSYSGEVGPKVEWKEVEWLSPWQGPGCYGRINPEGGSLKILHIIDDNKALFMRNDDKKKQGKLWGYIVDMPTKDLKVGNTIELTGLWEVYKWCRVLDICDDGFDKDNMMAASVLRRRGE